MAMVFVPEGQHDRSQAQSASAVWTFLAHVPSARRANRKQPRGFSPGNGTPKEIALKGRPSVGHYFRCERDRAIEDNIYLYIVVNATRPPFQGDFSRGRPPRAEAPG